LSACSGLLLRESVNTNAHWLKISAENSLNRNFLAKILLFDLHIMTFLAMKSFG
jgi:hypothetical protein